MTNFFKTTSALALSALVAVAPIAASAQATGSAGGGASSSTSTGAATAGSTARDTDGQKPKPEEYTELKQLPGTSAFIGGEAIEADKLLGMRVVDPAFVEVGKVGALLVRENGPVEAVVVNLVDKPVMLELTGLQIVKDSNGFDRLQTPESLGELHEQPEFMGMAQ